MSYAECRREQRLKLREREYSRAEVTKVFCFFFSKKKDFLASLYVFAYCGKTRTTSYTDLRQNLAAVLDSVAKNHAPVIITCERGKPAAVLMSLEDFASYEETRHLLRSPANAERLLQAVAGLDAGGGVARALME